MEHTSIKKLKRMVEMMEKIENIDEMLKIRGTRYGAFEDNARITQKLNDVIIKFSFWDKLTYSHKDGLHQIFVKISRAFSGDYTYFDNYKDIAGYSTRILEYVIETDFQENLKFLDEDSRLKIVMKNFKKVLDDEYQFYNRLPINYKNYFANLLIKIAELCCFLHHDSQLKNLKKIIKEAIELEKLVLSLEDKK